MRIHLNKLGKRFNRDWIFRNLDLELTSGKSYAVVGPNGSGKSTLLKVLSGFLPATTGSINYFDGERKIESEYFYKQLVFVAPYLELIEEFTLQEFLQFHFKFKPIAQGQSVEGIIDALSLPNISRKFIHDFSSGMKQRVKLSLAFYSEVPVIILDEPTVNLDEQGVQWYLDEVLKISKEKLVIVASNQPREYDWTNNAINIHSCKF